MSLDWTPFDHEHWSANPLPEPDEMVWVFDAYYEGITLGWWNGTGWRGVDQGDDIGVMAWMPLQRPLTGPLCPVCGRPESLDATVHADCRSGD